MQSRIETYDCTACSKNCKSRIKKKFVFEDPTSVEIANQSPIAKQVLDTQKLEKLGWKPAFSIEEGISHTLSICKGI